MADDKTPSPVPSDPSRISLSDAEDVAYWTDKLGVSRDKLAKAVVSVGNSAEAVAAHLQRGVH